MESSLKNKFDSIIFDLDGTLWDSTETIAQAWQAALKQAPYMSNEVMDRERVRSITGMTYDKIFEKLSHTWILPSVPKYSAFAQ
jgi:phosphoglycolate phosphatase